MKLSFSIKISYDKCGRGVRTHYWPQPLVDGASMVRPQRSPPSYENTNFHNLEKFSSINGPSFYNMPINDSFVELIRNKWVVPEYTILDEIKIKNFMGGKQLDWKIKR